MPSVTPKPSSPGKTLGFWAGRGAASPPPAVAEMEDADITVPVPAWQAESDHARKVRLQRSLARSLAP